MREKTAGASAFGKRDLIKANLLHLGGNMWCDWQKPGLPYEYVRPSDTLRLDKRLWDDLLKEMVGVGFNMVVIDLGEGVRYESHPEIAAKKAWPVSKLRDELAKMRKMGLEPIPKMNFSTCHDHWLGPYSRMVSTPVYYEVCADLIQEACEIFDRPRFFHLGMDEEVQKHQASFEYAVIRQHDLWWRDLYFLLKEVEKRKVRPWVWSDLQWNHPEEFLEKMPASVLQSNWFYEPVLKMRDARAQMYVQVETKGRNIPLQAFRDLDAGGYDQVPTGSNHFAPENIVALAQYAKKHLSPEHLWGLMQTPWRLTMEEERSRHLEAIEWAGKAFRILET